MTDYRPGGLTALAVINFASALMKVFSIFAIVFFLAVLSDKVRMPADARRNMDRDIERVTDKGRLKQFLVLGAVINGVSALLLAASGIGYLQQKRILGKVVGNVAAVIGIAVTLVSAKMLPASAGGGFTMATIIGMIYPLFTLLLLNFTFREDFPN